LQLRTTFDCAKNHQTIRVHQGFLFSIFLMSKVAVACPPELRRFLESSLLSPSPLLIPETGEGLVVVDVSERFSKLQTTLTTVAPDVFLKLGVGKHRLELIAHKPGKDFLAESQARNY